MYVAISPTSWIRHCLPTLNQNDAAYDIADVKKILAACEVSRVIAAPAEPMECNTCAAEVAASEVFALLWNLKIDACFLQI